MSDRYDFVAINRRGVYALCEDLPGDPGQVARDFCRRVRARGHKIERVTVAEAVERHLAYLMFSRHKAGECSLLADEAEARRSGVDRL